MVSQDLSTISQLLYPTTGAVHFARIVAELDAVLKRLRNNDVVITWDCDDLVTFDMPETRILMAWSEIERRGVEGCLTVAVGPVPQAGFPSDAEHDILCSRLVERIQGRFPPSAVLWRQIEGAVTADYVDDLVEALPNPAVQNLPPVDSILDALSRADQKKVEERSSQRHPRAPQAAELSRLAMEPEKPAPQPQPQPAATVTPLPRRKAATGAAPATDIFPEASNDRPDLPKPRNAELARLRDALYPADPTPAEATAATRAETSTQMRLAVHCMNATLIVVYAPLGAAVMTYSILRGEDMRFSGRMMALAGTFFALANSPIGQTMAAVARSIS